jgi:hypothetical protein
MEIIDQNLGANFREGNSACDNDLPGYNKTDQEGVDGSHKPPSNRFRERTAMSFSALKVAHGNLRQNSIATPWF